jgi:Tol biopolymer transport system component
MLKKLHAFLALIALLAVALACANPVGGTAPKQPANVETVVAATIQALTAPAPKAGVTNPTPSTSDLLPRSLYFLNNDAAGIVQVYRLEKDGKTIKQITFEPAKVDYYDVSLADASVAYVSNNKMYTVKADGSNRSMVVDGGPHNENEPFFNAITNPVWSPNGQSIAFGYKGLNFYSITTGQYSNMLKDQIEDQNGFSFPRELYRPEKYAADGSKLVITLLYFESASAAVYYPNGNVLVRLKNDEGAMICCGNTNWTADGSALYAAYANLGMYSPGLWRVDSVNGTVTTLVKGDLGNGTFNFADAPHLAPDGQLYYFIASQTTTDVFASSVRLQLVRSAPDGVTNKTILRPETYQNMNEALWAPDASFVVVAEAPIQDVYEGGAVQLVYTDVQKGVISLLPFAMEMKWGP